MPRRIYEYEASAGWGTYNLISTIGSFILGLGILVTVINVLSSLRKGAIAGPDPVEGEHTGVVHDVAPAGAQLRRHPAHPPVEPMKDLRRQVEQEAIQTQRHVPSRAMAEG